MTSTRSLRVLGVVRTGHTSREETPVQSALNADDAGRVELDEHYADALDGLDGFSHAWLVTWLGGDGDDAEPALRQVPFLLGPHGRAMGILATRGPRRPNPIGLSLVRLGPIEGCVVRFRGVDMVDGTLLLDIKPYVAAFDQPTGDVRCGWFEDVELPLNATPASLRRSPPG
jgi:tRNA (adenine37-N6)-methyltransferase